MIPKVVHFIYGFKHHEIKFYEFINIILSFRVLKPDSVIIHSPIPLEGKWFLLTKSLVKNISIEPIDMKNLKEFDHYAHKADFHRLQVLKNRGGIYLDIDVFCYRNFDNLLAFDKTIMGIQKNRGLCNAVIISPKNDDFISHWITKYTSFNNVEWDYHSVVLPYEMYLKDKSMLECLPETAFFFPLWHNKLREILEDDYPFEAKGYACHLWQTICKEELKQINPTFILDSNSFYSKVVRKFFEIKKWGKYT